MSTTFQLEGQEFIALNGGPQFTFSPAISFFVNCEPQEEVDEMSCGRSSPRADKRQIWCVMADYSLCFGRDVARQGCREIGQRHEGVPQMDRIDIQSFNAGI